MSSFASCVAANAERPVADPGENGPYRTESGRNVCDDGRHFMRLNNYGNGLPVLFSGNLDPQLNRR